MKYCDKSYSGCKRQRKQNPCKGKTIHFCHHHLNCQNHHDFYHHHNDHVHEYNHHHVHENHHNVIITITIFINRRLQAWVRANRIMVLSSPMSPCRGQTRSTMKIRLLSSSPSSSSSSNSFHYENKMIISSIRQ